MVLTTERDCKVLALFPLDPNFLRSFYIKQGHKNFDRCGLFQYKNIWKMRDNEIKRKPQKSQWKVFRYLQGDQSQLAKSIKLLLLYALSC